jgi:hypothetical protein
MYLFVKRFYKTKQFHIFIVSFLVFVVLNVIENYVHYNIGRNRETESIQFSAPSKKDWIRILLVMTVFAFLQGGFTYLLD